MMRITVTVLLLCLSSLAWPTHKAQAFNCDVTATSLNFGSYDVFSNVPLDSTASINVSCNIPPQNPQAPLAVTISLSPGNSGSFAPRSMQSTGADILDYNLYTNASMSTIWGDGGGSSTVQSAFVTSAMPWNATLFGRIPARQNVSAGSYSDTITVTIDF
jgi:spore coat protein U-like protein